MNSGMVAWPAAATPSRRRTLMAVKARILRSSASPAWSTYQGVSAVDLAPTCDARRDLVSSRLLRRVAVEIAHQQRPGANEAHVAAEHIPELRQLVEAQPPHEASDARQALFVGEQCARGVALVGHRSELGDVEGASAEPRTCLSEEYWPADGRSSCDGDDRDDRCRRCRDWQSDGEVEEPLSTALVEGRGHVR